MDVSSGEACSSLGKGPDVMLKDQARCRQRYSTANFKNSFFKNFHGPPILAHKIISFFVVVIILSFDLM